MKGRPAYRKQLFPTHPFQPDDAECCAWRDANNRVCGLPQYNRHHSEIARFEPTTAQPIAEEREQLRLDIDG